MEPVRNKGDVTAPLKTKTLHDKPYVDITEDEFNARMANYKQTLAKQFAESHRLEEEIMKQLDALLFNANVGNNE